MNGTPISTSQLKELSEQLVLMHTQHANQKLLQTKHQLELLDEYADQGVARARATSAFKEWAETVSALNTLKADASQADTEREKHRKVHGQTQKQTHRCLNRHTGRHTDGQTHLTMVSESSFFDVSCMVKTACDLDDRSCTAVAATFLLA